MASNLHEPRPEELKRDNILHDILDHIDDFHEAFPRVDLGVLKHNVLEKVINEDFDPEVQIRGFLRTFRHTRIFKDAFEQLDGQLQAQITNFMSGEHAGEVVKPHGFQVRPSPQAKHHFSLLDFIKGIFTGVDRIKDFVRPDGEQKAKDMPLIYEDAAATKPMEVYSDTPFENWGQSVKNKPRFTFVPSTVVGIQNLVSWSSTFSQDGEILISLLNLHQVNTLPDPMSILPKDDPDKMRTELKSIQLYDQSPPGQPRKRWCRIGVSVTNEDFRRWAVAHNAWTLPVDVILVEVTIGGVNAPICHGAGRRHRTISDYVRGIEYVDVNGEHRTVADPEQLKAAAGCFGLLGVVTHVTFELDAMTYAIMEPRKIDIGLAIPPMNKSDIPAALRQAWYDDGDVESVLDRARQDFEKRAAEDYYSEWFWFTYQQKAWVNTWNTTEDASEVTDYPSEAETFLQWVQGWIGGVITSSEFFRSLPGRWQTQLMATLGMAVLPPTFGEDQTPTIKTFVPDGLHFRRGVQNMRVRDMEYQIPIPSLASDPSQPDFSVVRRAWWDAINLVYADSDKTPMRLTLELRIMGGSDLILAPQQGNKHGTASIEVLSLPDAVSDGEWTQFLQQVSDAWMSYEDEGGRKLNVRPHWAKEWEGLRMGKDRLDARQYLKTVSYREAIPKFRDAMASIGRQHGWGLNDLKARFSNALWDEMIYS